MRLLLNLLLLITIFTISANAQDATMLLKEGQQLAAQKNYAAAIEKYKGALATEPNNPRANYEMAFALFASGKGLQGIPNLEKAVQANTNAAFTAAAYSLMGSIYGNANQLPKAVAAYKNGLKTDSANQRIYYNLGIVLYRGKQYGDAEQTFLEAIKRDSADAGSVRMYALTTFHENKRAEALLGFCRFLQLEPNSTRSKEAFGNLQNILQRGTLPAETGYQPTSATKAEAFAQNKIITKALSGFMTRKYASPTALLTAQLKELYAAFGDHYRYSAYYNKLAHSDNFETFVRVISQNSLPENAKWVKENEGKVAELDSNNPE
ncbi:tetratricopeptide repeat protein [Mucilaginibacter phyllosphaerae]|nr:tetratricopeptide repeat protein [Mucilaginibacter phyllosphaerae]MBB3971080.1 tetratricopeptide (TPR) repeat protein [Mucilaginibacter phyllosphaerae]GGH22357.1 hypothetical protein GCM10007352_35620 [Mucilaginibacter phyllosphaerae]